MGGRVVSADRRPFSPRTLAASSREAQRSASNNSWKCSRLLLRSSLSIWAARARHLFSARSTAAFSIGSRPSNSELGVVLPLTVMADLPKSPVAGSTHLPFFGPHCAKLRHSIHILLRSVAYRQQASDAH